MTSNPLTYHGVEVPVWEERVGPMPEGGGWVCVDERRGVIYGTREPVWRRPHPWRVMLEGWGGDGEDALTEDEHRTVEALRAALALGWKADALRNVALFLYGVTPSRWSRILEAAQ